MTATVTIQLDGVAEAIRSLEGLKGTLRNRILRKAVLAGTGPIYDEVRAQVPVDTRLLRKSIGRKVKVYRNTGVVVGIIGPRAGFKKEVVPRGRKTPMMRNPTKYAHLAERHSPFIAPAWAARHQQVQDLIAKTIATELEKQQ